MIFARTISGTFYIFELGGFLTTDNRSGIDPFRIFPILFVRSEVIPRRTG